MAQGGIADLETFLELLPGEKRIFGNLPARRELAESSFSKVENGRLVHLAGAFAEIASALESLNPFLCGFRSAVEIEPGDMPQGHEAVLEETAKNSKVTSL
jgi:hypothetical protein